MTLPPSPKTLSIHVLGQTPTHTHHPSCDFRFAGPFVANQEFFCLFVEWHCLHYTLWCVGGYDVEFYIMYCIA